MNSITVNKNLSLNVLESHTIKLLSKANIKCLESISFIHILDFSIDKTGDISEMNDSCILNTIKPIMIKDTKIPVAKTLILRDNKVFALSDGRHIYTKGFNDYNNLIKMIKVNTPKIIFSLPEIDLRFIFFQSFNNELFILPNFQSNELIFAQEYFKK